MEKYKLKPEHESQIKEHTQKWIDNGLSTKPMDDYDKQQMIIAIKGLYESAGLKSPPDERIIFVPSPMVARFAGGFAASIWYKRKTHVASYDATLAATRAATFAATDAATYAATYDATRAATYAAIDAAIDDATRAAIDAAIDDATLAATRAATFAATDAATYAAILDATYDAIDDATDDATDAAIDDAIVDATLDATLDATYALNKNWFTDIAPFVAAGIKLNVGKFGFSCAASSWRMIQGGNFWSGSCCFLSFFKDVAKLNIDYSKYFYWEKACLHGSYRIMHPEFCLISDRPTKILLDNGVPHSEKEPYIQWSDGTGFYAFQGIRVPAYWITNPELLTPEDAITWENIEQRRAACTILGWHNILHHPSVNAKVIAINKNPEIGTLYEINLPDAGKTRIVKAQCATGRTFGFLVPTESKTPAEGLARTYGWDENMSITPEEFLPKLTA